MGFKVPILMYHRVGKVSRDKRFTVSPRCFKDQMQFLTDNGYAVLDLDRFIEALSGPSDVLAKSIAITFDDGFQETFDFACPVLKDCGYSATFFLISRLIGKTNEWMRTTEYESAPLMGWNEARTLLAEGFCLGSHTATHPVLPEIGRMAAKKEIEESKRELEEQLGIAIRYFAYPFGRLNESVRNLVRQAGYAAACSTRSGFNGNDVDRFALRRLDIHGTVSMGDFRRNLLFGENRMTVARVAQYYARRVVGKFANYHR